MADICFCLFLLVCTFVALSAGLSWPITYRRSWVINPSVEACQKRSLQGIKLQTVASRLCRRVTKRVTIATFVTCSGYHSLLLAAQHLVQRVVRLDVLKSAATGCQVFVVRVLKSVFVDTSRMVIQAEYLGDTSKWSASDMYLI